MQNKEEKNWKEISDEISEVTKKVKDSLPENFMELFKKNLLKRGAYFAKEFTNKV